MVAPIAPSGVEIENNIATARSISWLGYISKARPYGEWDYKRSHGPEYANFANYNYGVTGTAAGYSEETLYRCAGLVGYLFGTYDKAWGYPWGGYPYGDDPIDQLYIQLGILDYNANLSQLGGGSSCGGGAEGTWSGGGAGGTW